MNNLIKKIDKRDCESMKRICAEVDLHCQLVHFDDTDVVVAIINSDYELSAEFLFTLGERFNSACECDRLNIR